MHHEFENYDELAALLPLAVFVDVDEEATTQMRAVYIYGRCKILCQD